MLNISKNSVSEKVRKLNFKTLTEVEKRTSGKVLKRIISITLIVLLVALFLPWTQNIRSGGKVTTLLPNQRPQKIHSVIAGQVKKWYVKEGDHVKEGDTIAFITEIKDDYFDPLLLERTKNQQNLKELTAGSYAEKVDALENQIKALQNQKALKMEQSINKIQQADLKVQNDSINLAAAEVNYETALKQFERMENLHEQGLKSLTDLENRRVKMRDAYAKFVEAKNKWLTSKNELINAKIELSNVRVKFETEIAKAKSDKFSALSNKLDSEGSVNKLQNQYANYEKRQSYYYITAPQDCYITQLQTTGIGETIKEGDPVVSIMPTHYQLAVEMYVEPLDLPLLEIGQHVRIQFDGWPAVVFSGWPNISYGTYGGQIYAIDQFISPNGKYRILVEPDPIDHPWPEALRYGSGTNSMVLLDDVPIWYELWRRINGFPPDYYQDPSLKTFQSEVSTVKKDEK